jgi:hypothetical protein
VPPGCDALACTVQQLAQAGLEARPKATLNAYNCW